MMIEVPRPPSAQDIVKYRAKGWWKDQTFSQILETRGRETPDREAMSDARRRITYGELWAEVRRFAEFLRRQGVQRGDVVTLQLPNRIEFPVVFFSLELIGAVANKISADFRAIEVEYILKFSRSKAYVCASRFKGFDFVAMICELRPRLPELSLTICVDEVDAPDVVSFAKVVHDTPEIDSANCIRMSPLDVMRMCFTSGTTGNPKGVLHCFNTTLCTCETFNRELAVTDKDVMLDYLPVGLNWGYMTLVQAAMAGARVVLMERFSAEAALELIERERVTYIPTAPASIVAMLNSPELARRDLSSLRIVVTGDLGQYADKEGNVRIAGRKKEIINRGGKKYFPREIEELLYQHPTIVQAAIVGAPDSRLGEKNCLCAIIKPGSSLTLDEVVSFLKGRVADYKLPEALVVMSDFPMTPTGKIRRPELVKRVAGTV